MDRKNKNNDVYNRFIEMNNISMFPDPPGYDCNTLGIILGIFLILELLLQTRLKPCSKGMQIIFR